MKLNKFLWSLSALAALGLASCSSDKLADEPNVDNQSQPDASYIAVKIVDNQSRANYDGDYEAGADAENKVETSRFYFFDVDGNPVDVADSKNYLDLGEMDKVGDDMENVEAILQTVLVLTTESNHPVSTVKKMAVVLNYPSGIFTGNTLSLSQLQAKIHTGYLNVANNFVMASAVYNDNTPPANVIMVDVTPYPDKAQAMNNPVDIYVERVAAKVRMGLGTTVNGADDNSVKVTIGGKTYYDTKATTKDDKAIVVDFGKWIVTAETNQTYVVKNLNTTYDAALTSWNSWNAPLQYRSFWANTPATATNTYYPFREDETQHGEIADYLNGGNSWAEDAYTLENTKHDGESYITGLRETEVLVKGRLGYINSGTFTPLTIGIWGGINYEITDANDQLHTAALSYLATQNFNLYFHDVEGTWTQLDADDLTYGTKSAVDNASTYVKADVSTLVTSKRYQSYIQLNATSATYTWKKLKESAIGKLESAATKATITETDLEDATEADINTMLKDKIGYVKVYTEGDTYYHFKIRHLHNTADELGYYGVVRNHIYSCTVAKLVGLGTPVYDPDEFIIPEDVEENDSYVAARINVLSWRIVPNTVQLGN